MSKNLYVGNLAYGATEQELNDMFGQFGPVDSVRIIKDKATGRSKGFAFVEMTNDGDAINAVEKLNGTPCQGRNITVSEARPPQPKENRGFGGGGGGGGRGFGGGGGGGGRGFGGGGGGGRGFGGGGRSGGGRGSF